MPLPVSSANFVGQIYSLDDATLWLDSIERTKERRQAPYSFSVPSPALPALPTSPLFPTGLPAVPLVPVNPDDKIAPLYRVVQARTIVYVSAHCDCDSLTASDMNFMTNFATGQAVLYALDVNVALRDADGTVQQVNLSDVTGKTSDGTKPLFQSGWTVEHLNVLYNQDGSARINLVYKSLGLWVTDLSDPPSFYWHSITGI